MAAIKSIIWKAPVVFGALVVGCFAASQVGWSGAESIAERGQAGFVTDLLLFGTLAITYGTIALVQRIAKPMLWIVIPIVLYFAIVPGAWNGFASDFDRDRGVAIREHYANAYILEHMSDRGRFLSCQDSRIRLDDDAKAVCARVFNTPPGKIIPGSEHRCGASGFLECSDIAPETTPNK